MRPEQIRVGAYYQGADGSVRLVRHIPENGGGIVYGLDLHTQRQSDWNLERSPYCEYMGDGPHSFSEWAVREVRPVWQEVETREEATPHERD